MGLRDSPLAGRVIFVVGARRSGTNWLQRVLASHPQVAAAPSETFLFSAGLRQLRERFHHGAMSSTTTGTVYADRETLLDHMRALCDAVFTGLIEGLKPSASHLVERTPDHAHHLDLIGEVYPDAHVVHIIRDGRDVVRSLLSQHWGSADAREAAREWRTAVESARTASARLASYHELRYEELFDDPHGSVRRLFGELGLEAGDEEVARAVAEAAARFNVDRADSRLGSGKWRQGLAPAVLEAVLEETRDTLSELGYEVEEDNGNTASLEPRTPPRATDKSRGPNRTLWKKLRGAVQPGSGSRGRVPDPKRKLPAMQVVADRFLAASTGDPSATLPLLHRDVHVRIVAAGERYEGRGEAAGRKLVEVLQSDGALRGRQVLGYLHPSFPGFTFVSCFETEAACHPRVIVLDIAGERVKRVAYYAFASEMPEQA